MKRVVKVAATQMACSWDRQQNMQKAEKLVRGAAAQGAEIILLQELFATPYFCQQEHDDFWELATEPKDNPAIRRFQRIAEELHIVLPISFFEKAGKVQFNSVAMLNADGTLMGIYRKTHIPDGPGYEEKFYFSPGDTGFCVWNTAYAKIGVGICWDQWFPEAARCMALKGAELLLYPTAIGSEPMLKFDSRDHWRRCIQGHAASNMIPIVVSNRVGTEKDKTEITFYGSSFIAGPLGEVAEEMNRSGEGIITHTFDLEKIENLRRSWGIFRDRRPEMYSSLLTMDDSVIKRS
ncbi:MAG: N-carbamoylputrescine amidase [Sporolactobacillus sp.]|jgi:N-carbamoylputrescine amidase|nr:N-carbamoylputrescine amidase [Sporolactobacillus sp.]